MRSSPALSPMPRPWHRRPSCHADHPQPSNRMSTHGSRFMPQPVCHHRTCMLRVCCHGGRLPDSVRAVCMQTGVPLCGVHSPHNAYVRVAPSPRLIVTLFFAGEYWRDQFSLGSTVVNTLSKTRPSWRSGVARACSARIVFQRAVTTVAKRMRQLWVATGWGTWGLDVRAEAVG